LSTPRDKGCAERNEPFPGRRSSTGPGDFDQIDLDGDGPDVAMALRGTFSLLWRRLG
jgi:hypothetical protein